MAKVVDIGEGKGTRRRPKHSTLPPKPRGRPPKYCPEVHAKLVEMTRAGGFRKLAAQYAGVALPTLLEWLADADKNPKSSPYGKLADDLALAEAERALEALQAHRAGRRKRPEGGADWDAASDYLQRKYPAEYGRRVQEIHGKDGAELTFRVEWPSAKRESGDEG